MREIVVYLKCKRDVEVSEEDVFLTDVASVACADENVLAKCKAIKVYHFKEKRRAVISIFSNYSMTMIEI